ncbi:MAG: type II toxin-antitoxin system prevent-host-death family antitoxin [Acidobacteria bacterium]|nr:type II toxin-antitoxin system prevent-host-death family antitoxin [Acidobacteriota bacterium]
MERIAVEELGDKLQSYLRKAADGASFEIVDQERTLAVLGPPVEEQAAWRELVERGVVIPAEEPGLPLESASMPADQSRPASALLEQLRGERL